MISLEELRLHFKSFHQPLRSAQVKQIIKPIHDQESYIAYGARLSFQIQNQFYVLPVSKQLELKPHIVNLFEQLIQEDIDNLYPGHKLFCFGYQGTDISYNRCIVNDLFSWSVPQIYANPNGSLQPTLSTVGVLLKDFRFSCKGCVLKPQCTLKVKCYD